MPPTEPNEEEKLEQVTPDEATPFQPADPNPSPSGNTDDPIVAAGTGDLPDDHPATDTNMDPQETYDEGISGAAEVTDESSETAVTDYTPPADAKTDETKEDDSPSETV